MRFLRRFFVGREIQRRLDQILASDHEINADTQEFRHGAYLALRSLKQWFDGDHRVAKESRPAEILKRHHHPGDNVMVLAWDSASEKTRIIMGPLVEWLPDGSATVFDTRTHLIRKIPSKGVMNASVREDRQERGAAPRDAAGVPPRREA